MLISTLRGNALFSLLSGLIMLFAAPWVGNVLGAGAPWLIRLIGAGLLLFAAALFLTSRQRPIDFGKARLFIWMDIAWVVGSAVLLLVAGSAFSTSGTTVILSVAAVVGLFAALQYIGLQNVMRSRSSA